MAKYAWMTDIHLDSCDHDINGYISGIAHFLKREGASGLFLSGDISIGSRLITHLSMLETALQKPIYFTLGNHDFWDSSYEQIDKQMREVSRISNFLKYLPQMPYIQIGNSTALIGANGWYDAIHGEPSLKFMLMDWIRMRDYQELLIGSTQNFEGSARLKPCTDKHLAQIVELSRKFSMNSAHQVARGIKAAKRNSMRNLIILSHVPPFPNVCFHKGLPSEPMYLAWYSSKLLGDVLTTAADQLPDIDITVLCGHTHSYKREKIKKNLQVIAGRGEYANPVISDVLDIA